MVRLLTAAVYCVFGAWWFVRRYQSTALFPTDVVRAYLLGSGLLVLIWAFAPMRSVERPRRLAAAGAGFSTVILAALALTAISCPQAAMLAACERPVRCEDFSGALLAYGFWLVSLVGAGLAAALRVGG